MLDLTIAISVRNEERNLPGCLRAIGDDFAQRVVLIDSGSTDRTKLIGQEFGAEIVDFVWNGRFPKKRNAFLRDHTPKTKWVLFLDADEFLTEPFKAEVRKVLPDSELAGFWLNYSIYFLGKELRHGYPLKKLALFRVGAGEYEKIEEDHWSSLDMEVHEHPILQGSTGKISGRIDHQDFRGVSHYAIKHNEYSSWEAARYVATNATLKEGWTWKQRLKYRLLGSPFIGPVYFVGSFFLMGGFLDGSRGLAFSLLKAAYFTQVYCKIRELQIKAESIIPK